MAYVKDPRQVQVQLPKCDVCQKPQADFYWTGTIMHGSQTVQSYMVRCNDCYYLAPLPKPTPYKGSLLQTRLPTFPVK